MQRALPARSFWLYCYYNTSAAEEHKERRKKRKSTKDGTTRGQPKKDEAGGSSRRNATRYRQQGVQQSRNTDGRATQSVLLTLIRSMQAPQ